VERVRGDRVKLVTREELLALTLLVTQVVTNDHDPTMTADHFALVTNLFDAGLNLHGCGTPLRAQPAEMLPGRLSM
jgi:hypothetical protein